MPENCNGLALIDPDLEFCKLNCEWIKKSGGRKPVKRQPVAKKINRNKINKPQSICLVIEKDQLDFIKSQALQRSVQEGHLIEANQLIREALQRAFPTPKQFDMFGARR